MIRFAGTVVAVALGSILLVMLAFRLRWIESVPSYYLQSSLLLGLFTLVIYRYLYRLDKPQTFIAIYLLSMTVKLIAYGVYVVLMVIDDRSGANANVLFFLVLYVLLTALEVGFLHRKIAGNRPR